MQIGEEVIKDIENDVEASSADAFIARWQGVKASELATSQSFIINFCELLGVPRPHANKAQDYMFERPVTFTYADGSYSAGRVDCYRRGCFVIESKKNKASVGSERFSRSLLEAHSQAQNYVRALPAEEGRPPFLLVFDIGTVIEVYAEFSRSGGTYIPFPDPRSHRISLADLRSPEVRERLRLIWTDPDRLDPTRASAKVTAEVSAQLARLAKSLEEAGNSATGVAAYLTRALFSMFAEDVGLLPPNAFLGLLKAHRDDPATLQHMLEGLWNDMDKGGFSNGLAQTVLKFNGKLFKGGQEHDYSLLLTSSEIDLLIAAAKADWRQVEPAIFGTLLERALSPTERHALGAHYTPRAYVERLVLPTIMEPLREEWANARAVALLLVNEANELDSKKQSQAKLLEARDAIRQFHHRLCTLRVLDPACGSGNFLYVTLEHLKRLEGEVFNELDALGDNQSKLSFEGESVTLQQLRGIELNPRAAALAELTLWIGYLQWQIRTFGSAGVAEPVIHNYGNIENRDAVLAWDARIEQRGSDGQVLMRWNGVTRKVHGVTGAMVPDETAQSPQWRYEGARPAAWPEADFIVGNPPFIGAAPMRATLGEAYVASLRQAWPQVPESADFVMFWWAHGADLVTAGRAKRMGFITTNSLRQTFNRRVVQTALDKGNTLLFAIPDHPWVDGADGAAVRIAMSVLQAGSADGRLLSVANEVPGHDGEVVVTLDERRGTIHADLSTGANLGAAKPLKANAELSNRGVQLFGGGFMVTGAQAATLLKASAPTTSALSRAAIIRDYRNGRDLTDRPRDVQVIDAFGLTADELRLLHPGVYQWLLDRVKPERDQNNRESRRKNWWLFGETNPKLRKQLAGLSRYIATVETAKHRIFQFLDASILPDNKLVAIALDDALWLGVLSSKLHSEWALATGSTLEDRPVYVKSSCFEAFPFPDIDTGLTPALADRIRYFADQIDAHRKTQQELHASVTLTGMYNVLEKLRSDVPLTAKEKELHEDGLVGILRSLHEELDMAVVAAYGLTHLALNTEAMLAHLAELNARRSAAEESGQVRWLRPKFQTHGKGDQVALPELEKAPAAVKIKSKQIAPRAANAWPATMAEQVKAVADVLSSSGVVMDLDDIAGNFSSRGRWKERLPSILDTLAALGRVHVVNSGSWVNVV